MLVATVKDREFTAVVTWVSHSASILLACVSETLTLFGVAYSNENCCNKVEMFVWLVGAHGLRPYAENYGRELQFI
jgi:hypothetical protein